MSKRNENACICQEGASNERRVAMALVEAIDECRAENTSPKGDCAVYLILHQLCWLLGFNEPGSHERYVECCKAVGMKGY